jgi:sulfate adenylyltransferase subunit 1
MDLVEYSQATYDKICSDFRAFFAQLDPIDVRFIPMSALLGDMVVTRGENLGWYTGPTLMDTLETIEIDTQAASELRFPVQLVNRPPMPELTDFRGYMGRIASGRVSVGQDVSILPAGRRTKVAGIATFGGEIPSAFAPQSVTITLAEDVDISRGDMITGIDDAPLPKKEFEATLCWMSQRPMRAGAKYLLRHTTRKVKAVVSQIEYRIDPNTMAKETGLTELKQNDIARVTVKTVSPIACDPYRKNRETGAFILIDEANDTVGAGFVQS